MHELGLRLINENGSIGMTEYFSVNLCDVALADFTTDVVCVGTNTTITETSTGTLAGDVYSWDFDADGFEDANTAGNQSFNFSTSGIFNATLSIDRAGCVSNITIPVQVEAFPISDAGIDQTICNTTATLAANTPTINEIGAWTILSGTGIITNPTSPTTTITGISTSSIELIWTLTNTLGGCSNQNNVIISSNLPIIASATSQTVDIGQTVSIDVFSIASTNSGDVLTTSIITAPTQGDAVVLANGTIDFTPYDDASATDSFTYRITNQCSNFDENVASISIINQAPVIDSASFTSTANALELTFDLTTLISDPNNNLDFNSLRIVSQPISGAIAIIDASGVLIIDYRGISYSGIDELEIEICDLVGVCTVQLITIPNVEVGGENPPIKVFNAVSPNGDGFHDFLEIENIEFYPNNTVLILNRWGDEVSKIQGYNNQDIVFESTTLPAGTYYYHVLPGIDEVDTETGFFLLKFDK